jgi:hypothetical protein
MQATTELRKAGWYVTSADGDIYSDDDGHMWFAKDIALTLARNLEGMYQPGPSSTVKTVVTGYTEN